MQFKRRSHSQQAVSSYIQRPFCVAKCLLENPKPLNCIRWAQPSRKRDDRGNAMLKQQERNLLQGPALIAAVKQKMKMKEIYLSKPPMGYRCEGPAARPINRPWKKQKGLGENALSQVDANSKDHEQDRQTDAAYPVSSFRESVQRTLCTLFCLFQLGYPRISRESGTNQKHQTDPDHHKHFSNQNLTIPRPEHADSRQGQRHPC